MKSMHFPLLVLATLITLLAPSARAQDQELRAELEAYFSSLGEAIEARNTGSIRRLIDLERYMAEIEAAGARLSPGQQIGPPFSAVGQTLG